MIQDHMRNCSKPYKILLACVMSGKLLLLCYFLNVKFFTVVLFSGEQSFWGLLENLSIDRKQICPCYFFHQRRKTHKSPSQHNSSLISEKIKDSYKKPHMGIQTKSKSKYKSSPQIRHQEITLSALKANEFILVEITFIAKVNCFSTSLWGYLINSMYPFKTLLHY